MDVDQISTLFALLSFVALALAAITLTAVVTGQVERLRPYLSLLLPLALAIALVSTLGSLYYSGVEHYRPCRLCWWQRINMYPLVPILAVGLLRRDRAVAFYGLPLAIIGLGYSAYHLQVQWFPGQGSTCELEAPCTATWVDTFGFVSIPLMAGCGFIAIIGLLTSVVLLSRNTGAPVHQPLPHDEEQLV